MEKSNSDKIADICQWLGTDAFLYLQIMEVFRHADVAANNSNIADDMNDCLHKFHGYCKQIVEKNQHSQALTGAAPRRLSYCFYSLF